MRLLGCGPIRRVVVIRPNLIAHYLAGTVFYIQIIPGVFFHLQKNSGNFGGNFHRVKNVFHLTQVRSPPSDCDFTGKKFKNVAVNSLEVVRPFKSCKWNTHFHRKVSNGKTGLPFQKFRLFRKFSSGTNQKRVFHLHPNRNFRNFLVNGKRPP